MKGKAAVLTKQGSPMELWELPLKGKLYQPQPLWRFLRYGSIQVSNE